MSRHEDASDDPEHALAAFVYPGMVAFSLYVRQGSVSRRIVLAGLARVRAQKDTAVLPRHRGKAKT